VKTPADSSQATCWTMIQAAAAGAPDEREAFARRYSPVVRAYVAARWAGSPRIQDLDDAVQEVFVECFRQGGVLARADPEQPGGFRAFLYGVVRNVALRAETRGGRHKEQLLPNPSDLERLEDSDTRLSQVFDRAWAKALLREAGLRQQENAVARGEAACRRVELLRLRFQEGLPIRDIAKRWNVDAANLHHEYAKARQEFKASLLEVLAFHSPGPDADLEAQCAQLLSLLSAS
jgi:RNA polymerase sigma-70 factor (ECF subfamily)